MARPSKGKVIERRNKKGAVTYALRFTAYGKRRFMTLGNADEWDRARAEQHLNHVMADVERGMWKPPVESVVEIPTEEPTFHLYASEWLTQRMQEGLKPKTIVDLKWSLVNHLLPFFEKHRLSEITPREVKRYTQAKLAERNAIEEAREIAKRKGEPFSDRPLSNSSINHTLRHLAQILEEAVEDEILTSNPATGGRRRLKAAKPARPWVEPEQLPSLLDAATGTGRMLLALLAGTGLRISEALALRWQNIDLGTGTLYVVASKTERGVREVHLSHALREELTLYRAAPATRLKNGDLVERHVAASDFVICTSTGGRHSAANLRRDVLAKTVDADNVKLEAARIAPIPPITFHSLRRTYASLRIACGDDVSYVAAQLGHEDGRFTLRVYTQATKRRDRLAAPQLREYDRAIAWAQLAQSGTSQALTLPVEVEAAA